MNRLILSIIFPLMLCACHKSEPANFEGGMPEREAVALFKAESPKQLTSDNFERMLIRNGQIEFSSENVEETRKEISKICKDFNAYISSEEQAREVNRIQFEQVIRVPAARFDAFTKVIEGLGVKIDSRSFESQDVTEEFIDVEARIKTKKELEIRYIQLLSKAKNVTEMLSIESQISDVRSEIESMQARINFLNNRVGHSTLRLTYYQTIGTEPGFGSSLTQSFASGWNGLLSFLIGITAIWPFILMLATAVWLIRKWIARTSLKSPAQPVD
jgi:hypothetical protein